MRTFRVPLEYTETKLGYIVIEAEEEAEAVDAAMQMDRYTLVDDGIFLGSCGDEWNVEVLYEEEAEDVTPPSVSEGLWN